jgi:preprotein translocase subunit YajC
MGRLRFLSWGLLVVLLAGLALVGGCTVAPAEGQQQDTLSSILSLVIPLVLIFVVFYFLIIRPQRKREKEHRRLIEELKKGDRVITAGGIFGVIETTGDDSIVIKVESGATLRVARESIAGRRER